MTPETIQSRLLRQIEAAEDRLAKAVRTTKAQAAGSGNLGSGATYKRYADHIGDAIDEVVTACLADVPVIQARGGDAAFAYDGLKTAIIQMKLRAGAILNPRLGFDSPSAAVALSGIVDRRYQAAKGRIEDHEAGFDQDHPMSTGGAINISSSPGTVVQYQSAGASLNAQINIQTVKAAAEALEQGIPWPDLATEDAQEIRAEIDTIKAQTRKRSPAVFVMREAARSLRSLIESIAADEIKGPMMAAAQNLWDALT